MTRALLASLLFCACSPNPFGDLSPDGGRVNHGCSDVVQKVPVKVVDSAGLPVSGATVTAVTVQHWGIAAVTFALLRDAERA